MSEQRLKRIEVLLETCAKTAVNNREDIQSLAEQSIQSQQEMRQLREQMASLTDMFTDSIRVKKSDAVRDQRITN